MAVVVQYVVVRNGDEKMTFASKKEADAYDKELDIADALFEWMQGLSIDVSEEVLDDLSLQLARERNEVMRLLKGQKSNKPGQPAEAVKTGNARPPAKKKTSKAA